MQQSESSAQNELPKDNQTRPKKILPVFTNLSTHYRWPSVRDPEPGPNEQSLSQSVLWEHPVGTG